MTDRIIPFIAAYEHGIVATLVFLGEALFVALIAEISELIDKASLCIPSRRLQDSTLSDGRQRLIGSLHRPEEVPIPYSV